LIVAFYGIGDTLSYAFPLACTLRRLHHRVDVLVYDKRVVGLLECVPWVDSAWLIDVYPRAFEVISILNLFDNASVFVNLFGGFGSSLETTAEVVIKAQNVRSLIVKASRSAFNRLCEYDFIFVGTVHDICSYRSMNFEGEPRLDDNVVQWRRTASVQWRPESFLRGLSLDFNALEQGPLHNDR
jgi:hypothetical protein